LGAAAVKAWTEDATEQIATAEVLNAAGTSTGERLALIICDNAIEFMMIAFTEVEKLLVHKAIKPKDWSETKGNFHKLLSFTVSQEPKLGPHSSDIQSFHNTRNDLYHVGKPLSVKAEHVNKYLSIAKSAVQILLGESLSKEDWEKKVAVLNQAISGHVGKKIKATVTVEVKDGVVQVVTSTVLAHKETLCVVIDAFNSKMGAPPTLESLQKSLMLSGAGYLSGANLSKRIYDARRIGLIQKGDLILTPKGRKLVAQKIVDLN
jgi:hypothetical protein